MCFKRNIYRILAFLAILQPLVTCPGCSVKEDRASCPCLLAVLSQKAEGLDSSIVMTASGFTGKASGFVLDEVLDMSPAEKDGTLKWSWKVPRGKMYVNAVSPSVQANATELHKPWVKVEPGDEFPSLWTFFSEVSTDCEHVEVPVRLHKNYCGITFIVRDMSGTPFDFSLIVRGGICGYDIDGSLVPGEFRAQAEYRRAGGMLEAEVNVPRQMDNTLKLDIVSSDGAVRTFAIGNYIEASGYSWDSEDLKDIALEIDYSRTMLLFRIGAWEKYEQFEVVI